MNTCAVSRFDFARARAPPAAAAVQGKRPLLASSNSLGAPSSSRTLRDRAAGPRAHRTYLLLYLHRSTPSARAGTDKNLCRCFGAPVRRVFPDHLIIWKGFLFLPAVREFHPPPTPRLGFALSERITAAHEDVVAARSVVAVADVATSVGCRGHVRARRPVACAVDAAECSASVACAVDAPERPSELAAASVLTDEPSDPG